MTSREPSPPRWAQAMLHSLLRPCDRESISGDLLEEYRAARRPARGALGADAWYIGAVLSVLWQQIRPAALLLGGQAIVLALTVFRPGHHAANGHQDTPVLIRMLVATVWYGSVLPTPLVALFDALIWFVAAYRGVQRTGLVRTGVLVAGASSALGCVVLFGSAALITPGLAAALFAQPALVLILSVYLLVPLAYSAAVGALAGITARWLVPSSSPRARFLIP
jgi:hypothetical protein